MLKNETDNFERSKKNKTNRNMETEKRPTLDRYIDYLLDDKIVYAKQKVRERDVQWFDTMIELGHLTDAELINEVNEKLPEPKFE